MTVSHYRFPCVFIMSLTLICYRSVSHPLLSFSDEKALKLSAEYDVSMEEVLYPIDMFQIKVMKPFISKKNIDYNYKFLLYIRLNLKNLIGREHSINSQ